MDEIVKAPKPIDTIVNEGESRAFIPYFELGDGYENVPIYLRPALHYYAARMGFQPNCNKVYAHVPWMADHMIALNNSIMRDDRNELSEHFKYKLALSVARTHECEYCTSHHSGTLKRRWEYEDSDLETLLHADEPSDEAEAVAIEYANMASLDPNGVSDDLRARLAEHFNPQQVMEIVLCVGFWGMYAAMHAAMKLPIEEPMKGNEQWMHTKPKN